MEHYLVSARKYRPSTFGSVVGQKALTATLKNAIATGRLAHSYLFCGSRGVGKTSCARIFAKTINCEHPGPDGEACNECESCRSFNEGRSLNIVEMDAASNNSVDDIRQLVEQVVIPPVNGRYRVFIIDEVHMLTASAFNAFLKTLEEPPAHAIFILATTEKHKIIPTILSRCQIYDFNTISIRDMVEQLQFVANSEGISAEPTALGVIARKADGAMRDALSIFDQIAASTRGNITYAATLENLNVLDHRFYTRLIDAFLANNVEDAWLIYKEIREKGFESQVFIKGLGEFIRDLIVARDERTLSLLDADPEVTALMKECAAKCPPDFLYRAMALLGEADLNYSKTLAKQFLVEVTLAKLCQPAGPSPDNGHGEGQRLQPIARRQAESAPSPAPQPQPAAPQPQTAPATQAQTSAAPQPRMQPSQAAGARPAGVQGRPVGLHGPSLKPRSTGEGQAQQQSEERPANGERRSNSYTEDQLKMAWREFINANPTERILVNSMRASTVTHIEGDRYRVVLENKYAVDQFNKRLAFIHASMRNYLSNDHVTFEAEENTDASPASTWTDREVLNEMIQQDPIFHGMVEDFGLTLA